MSDFNRFDETLDDKEKEREGFLNFLKLISMASNAQKEDTNDHMATFFYAKYQAFIRAGFNEDQAFELLLTIVNGITARM